MKLKEKIENWYQGKYIPPPKNDHDSTFIFLSPGHYEKSTGAKIVEFHSKHWTVLVPIYLALLGVFVTVLVYLDPLNKSNKTIPPSKTEQQKINGNREHDAPPKQTKEINTLKI